MSESSQPSTSPSAQPHRLVGEADSPRGPGRLERIALVGTGLIGSSLAAALRTEGHHVVGFDAQPATVARAQSLGWIDEVALSLAAAVDGATIAVLAIPVGAIEPTLQALAPLVAYRPEVVVLDTGSVKTPVLRAVERALPHPERFVGCHPVAGTERSGPDAASATLFRDRLCVLTPTEKTRPTAIVSAAALWQCTGALTEKMSAEEHDQVFGWVSHLPHAVSFALAKAVGGQAAREPRLAGLQGAGFVDTTRIAGSNPVMWRDIFVQNREAVLQALDAFEAEVSRLRELVAASDGEATERWIAEARAGRERILGNP